MPRKPVGPVSARLVSDVWQHLRARDERPRPAVKAKLRITNTAEGSTRIDLMDEIGFWGITAQDFVDELLAIDADTIDLHISSPGGDVFDGLVMMNALADHPATVNVNVDGIAASSASFIAMAGDTVKMNRGSQMMIHDASGMCIGNASEMEKMKALLDRISDTIAGIYADRAGGKAEDWRDLMRDTETWYSGAEAVEAGLADTAVSGAKAVEPDEEDPDEDAEDEPDESEDDPDEVEEDPDEESEDEDEDDEAPAAKFAAAFSRFVYAGRAHAPAPPTPGKRPVAQFDPAAFRAAIREGVSP